MNISNRVTIKNINESIAFLLIEMIQYSFHLHQQF